MARPGFFNDNANRTFPFQKGTAGVGTPATGAVTMHQLPDGFVIDCGFIAGPESGFLRPAYAVLKTTLDQAQHVFSAMALDGIWPS